MPKVKLQVWHPLLGDFEVETEEGSLLHEMVKLNDEIKGWLNRNLIGGSMKPGLDHYVGRPFECVIQGDEAHDWALQLEGGVLIRNKDESRTAPVQEELDGTSLLFVALSELDTVLHFGTSNISASTVHQEITFTPTLYTLSDRAKYGEVEIYPQVVDPEETVIPPDPSSERVVDGPETIEEAAVEAQEDGNE